MWCHLTRLFLHGSDSGGQSGRRVGSIVGDLSKALQARRFVVSRHRIPLLPLLINVTGHRRSMAFDTNPLIDVVIRQRRPLEHFHVVDFDTTVQADPSFVGNPLSFGGAQGCSIFGKHGNSRFATVALKRHGIHSGTHSDDEDDCDGRRCGIKNKICSTLCLLCVLLYL